MRTIVGVVLIVALALFVRHDIQTGKADCLKQGGRWVHLDHKTYECRKW